MRPILAGISRHASKKRLFLGVVTTLVMAALAAPALANDGAEKVHFFTQSGPGFDCIATPAGTPSNSFAVIKRDGDGRVSAEVALKDLQPNTTYNVWFIEVSGSSPSGCGGANIIQVKTNDQGNANMHFGTVEKINGLSVAITRPFIRPDLQTAPVTFGK